MLKNRFYMVCNITVFQKMYITTDKSISLTSSNKSCTLHQVIKLLIKNVIKQTTSNLIIILIRVVYKKETF